MAGPDRQFWHDRFANDQTHWDRGAPSPRLLTWLADGSLPATPDADGILVPGCGRGHEVIALAEAGWAVTGLDYTALAVEQARAALAQARLPAGAPAAIVEADVLQWQPPAPVAAVYEQTCLCALHPDQWSAYAAQLHRWLRPGGRLLVLAMQCERPGAAEGRIEGPPYHVPVNALRALFPEPLWQWPRPPYAAEPHPAGWFELALVLTRV